MVARNMTNMSLVVPRSGTIRRSYPIYDLPRHTIA